MHLLKFATLEKITALINVKRKNLMTNLRCNFLPSIYLSSAKLTAMKESKSVAKIQEMLTIKENAYLLRTSAKHSVNTNTNQDYLSRRSQILMYGKKK